MKNKTKRILSWLFLISLALIFFGFVVGRRLKLTTVSIPLGLSAPVRLAVLGDFHLAVGKGGLEPAKKALALAQKQNPDALLFVGDYISGRGGVPHLQTLLEGIEAPLGVYAVLGNHDHWSDAEGVKKQLQAAGIKMLDNENVILHKGATRVALGGIDDLWAGKVNWEKAVASIPQEVPLILLSHNPDAALSREGHRARLIISGHTHGGQVYLPRPLHTLLEKLIGYKYPPATRYGRIHPHGLIQEPWGWVYITSGVSPGYAPPRWYTRPEVAVLEIY